MRTYLLAAVFCFVGPVQAQDFNYRFVQIGASASDSKDVDFEADERSVEFSWLTEQGLWIRGGIGRGEVDSIEGFKLPSNHLERDYLFMGGAQQHDARTSFWGGFTFSQARLDIEQLDLKANSVSMAVGGRYWLVNQLEGNASLRYERADVNLKVNSESVGDGTEHYPAATVGLRYQPWQQFSVGAEYDFQGDDARSYTTSINLRWQFD